MKNKIDPTGEILPKPATMDLKDDLVKALRDSEEHFKSLVNLLPICLMVRRGEDCLCQPRIASPIGLSNAEEMIGQSVLSLYPPDFQGRNPKTDQKHFNGRSLITQSSS